jgi:transposase-like protein
MPRLCSICAHPQRTAIDAALLRHAASYRGIASQFHVDDESLRRHEHRHLRLSWQLSKELGAMLSADNLLTELAKLLDETWAILTDAKRQGDVGHALAAIREGRGNVEAYAKLGALGDLEARLRALEAANDQQQKGT